MLDNKGRHEAERLLGESDHAAAIVILPDGRESDGSGVYEEGLINLAQDLRDDGVTVSWADGPGRRSEVPLVDPRGMTGRRYA
jgi:hypothetical protein